jgi:hypothetical protein
MTYRWRKRLSAVVLVFGLPLYVMAAVWLVDQFERPSILVELGVYVALGVAWAFPLKWLFKGIGKPDPDA